MQPQLQSSQPDLFSIVRRNLNSLKEKQMPVRKQAIDQLHKIITGQKLTSSQFEEIAHMGVKQLLRGFSDNAEYNRQHSVMTMLELLSRCGSIRSFLPYIFAVLTDRTNCTDLEGIANVPQKMRPALGQKPKMLSKLIENCQQIRLLYCSLMKRILSLVDEDDIRDKLDQIVNILRALIMDPAPEIQKAACELLQFFCNTFKLILLHYTEIMGRAILLPLVSKKSKIRIASLNALTAIMWCGLWKYNAFVFQNLIGFRDPNSVPIKDFYQPSNNINYLATFINDSNNKVRQQFMKHIKIWTCTIDDKYDHHGRIVPYIMSGLFDKDDLVRETSLQCIAEIGRQIQEEKEKELRDSKQYAIDAAWTWDGRMADLPTQAPLKGRPSIGSRYFIRGHVRKFWTALYKEIKDINFDNKIRAAYLMLYGIIFTQHYTTQYLDVMLPHLFSSCIAFRSQDEPVAALIRRSLHLIGRYCEVSTYHHIAISALKGELIQSEDFLRAAVKGITELINGAFQDIPEGVGLCHKRQDIDKLLALIEECEICSQIYRGNSQEGLQLSFAFLSGLKLKASQEDRQELLQTHLLSVLRLMAVSYYELSFGDLYAKDNKSVTHWPHVMEQFKLVAQLYPDYFSIIEQFLQDAYLSPPTLMDSSWKLIVFLHSLLSQWTNQEQCNIFKLSQEVICCSLSTNRSMEMLIFVFKYVSQLFSREGDKTKLVELHSLVKAGGINLTIFHPVKKVPVYDKHLIKPPTDLTLIQVNQDIFIPLFIGFSNAIQAFYINKVPIPPNHLSGIIHFYLTTFQKFMKNSKMVSESIRTVWLVLERAELNQTHLPELVFDIGEEKVVMFEEIIDFLVQRIEILNEPDRSKVNMVFDTLNRVVNCCPKINSAAIKLLTFYPNYPGLLEKFFKYALDEKDMETRKRYSQLLGLLCGKLRPWFELQLRLSEEKNRFARVNLLKQVLDRTR